MSLTRMLAACCLLALSSLSASGQQPQIPPYPDLDVTFIERSPRYIPGPWVYPQTGPQFMGVDNHVFTEKELRGEHKQWPDEGETVTFTAHIANKSNTPAPSCSFAWLLDGKEAITGTLPPIPPWQEVTQTCRWDWEGTPHTIAFTADTENAAQEICERNNFLEDRTDALTLQMRVTPQLYQAFHTQPNGIGSYSFEDWVQRHVEIMNGVLAGSVYPGTAPQGILERVRVDEVRIMSREDLTKSENQPQRFGFDGGWNFYDDNFPGWFNFAISCDFVTKLDTGLIHELTHQIGIIDMYTLVVAPSWNHVRDEDGDLVMIGYNTKQPGMMGGGGPAVDFDATVMSPLQFKVDADGNVAVGNEGFAAYSEETAGGLNTLHGLRRGHFGLYLFDLPAQNSVQILDNQGKPVEGASVTVYQQSPQPGPQSIPDTPVFVGTTNQNGIFPLGSAPFRDINCIGLNGILFFVIQARGHTEYRFLDICYFNIAKWRGSKESWTAVFRTGVPPEGVPQPPQNLRWGLLKPNAQPVLRWEPSPSPNVTAYNIYRQRTYSKEERPCSLSVSFESPYVKVATVPASQTSCEVKALPGYAGVNETPWFTVTAVDDQGRESGYAKNKELVRWGPWGNATVDREEPEVVKVTLPPGQSWIQVRNSFVARNDTQVAFQVKTESARPTALRVTVAGLVDVEFPITASEPGSLVPSDGAWHEVIIDLGRAINLHASNKNVTPDQARTTWNDAWLVTECKFGDWTGAASEEASFCLRRFQVIHGG